ncbi:hypothetical protein NDU88_006892 [Pleurodeles waltl]|uniref:Uncharacterized protein n=1 Tax=Pleurodeles waltl TaxID=8319 RepID=A0AAV7QM35_PLEWA|nr:hypothetical protein NDU88_006892 [Pleurodeles waltl]
MSPGQPGKFAQACFVGRASGDKERWKHGAAQGGEAAVQRVVRGSEAEVNRSGDDITQSEERFGLLLDYVTHKMKIPSGENQ